MSPPRLPSAMGRSLPRRMRNYAGLAWATRVGGVLSMQRADLATELDASALTELASGLKGQLVRPGDPAYDEHRAVWNGSVDRFPSLIARCIGVQDVRAALLFARRTGLRAAVRGGGHSFPGMSTCD